MCAVFDIIYNRDQQDQGPMSLISNFWESTTVTSRTVVPLIFDSLGQDFGESTIIAAIDTYRFTHMEWQCCTFGSFPCTGYDI